MLPGRTFWTQFIKLVDDKFEDVYVIDVFLVDFTISFRSTIGKMNMSIYGIFQDCIQPPGI
jgi:hypothetical protein